MSKWSTPKAVTALDLSFGQSKMKEFLPEMSEIPEDFKAYYGMGEARKWITIVDDWFFNGIEKLVLKPKAGINEKEAFRHLKSIMSSWEPAHEHKIAGVAWLMSLWFDDIQYEKVIK